MAKQVISNQSELRAHLSTVWREPLEYPLSIEIKPLKSKRSLPQNAKVNIWYNTVDKQFSLPSGDTRQVCKLHYGVPILRAESEEFRDFYDLAIKRLSYEDKKKAMVYVPVTSIMNVDQKTRYMNAIQSEYAEHGIILD